MISLATYLVMVLVVGDGIEWDMEMGGGLMYVFFGTWLVVEAYKLYDLLVVVVVDGIKFRGGKRDECEDVTIVKL